MFLDFRINKHLHYLGWNSKAIKSNYISFEPRSFYNSIKMQIIIEIAALLKDKYH